MPPSPAPARSESGAAANQFHVLNSSSGASAGQANGRPAYLQLPSPRGDGAVAAAAYRQLPSPQANAATLGRSTPVRAMTTYSPPATGGAAAMAVALRPPYGAAPSLTQSTPPPHLLQQLMILAGWGSPSSPRAPWMQRYAQAGQPPSPFSPSGRARGMPPPFASPRIPAANTGSGRGTVVAGQSDAGGSHSNPRVTGAVAAVQSDAGGSHSNRRGTGAGRGAVAAVQSDAGGSHSNPRGTGAGRGRLASARSLQITPVKTDAVPASVTNGDGAELQVLGPVLAMPTTGAAAKRKAAVRSPNGRLRKPRAAKGSGGTSTGPKKVASKNAAAISSEPAGTHPGAQGSDLPKAVSTAAPPTKGRKRKNAASASAPTAALTTQISTATRCSVVARRNNNSSSTVAAARPKKHTILTWLIDAGVLKEKEKVFYVPGPELSAAGNNRSGDGAKVVTGTVTRYGIHCSCCDTAMPLPAFSSHASAAGAEASPAAWERLLLMSGKPLLRCVQEAWEKERVRTFRAEEKAKAALEQDRERSAQAKKKQLVSTNGRQSRKGALALKRVNGGDRSDDACGVCADGGQLLCCDNCPSTFHAECLGVKVPDGSWVCHYCRCFVCLGSDGGVASCQQCARKYHQHCRPSVFAGHEIGSYCSETCNKIAAKLSEMVGATNAAGGDGFSWSLLKIHKDSTAGSSSDSSADIAVLQRNAKLAVALGVLDECFNPVKDRRTGIDMLHQAVYSIGSQFKRLSYEGFYTIVLEKDAEIISVALLRFHGSKLAEMPFAGTLPHYQRQGMMRRLVNAVEQVLSTLQVENLLIPAVAEVVGTWKRSFGFAPVEPWLREEAKRLSTVVVTGTTLLQKTVVVAATPPSSSSGQPRGDVSQAAAAAPPLSEDELAFLEMSWPVCSFTDLVAGIAYSPRPFDADPLARPRVAAVSVSEDCARRRGL